jgi:hypothetical protein
MFPRVHSLDAHYFFRILVIKQRKFKKNQTSAVDSFVVGGAIVPILYRKFGQHGNVSGVGAAVGSWTRDEAAAGVGAGVKRLVLE